MSDKKANIQELKDLLFKFREDRDWEKFHDIKNLAEAISIKSVIGYICFKINTQCQLNKGVYD